MQFNGQNEENNGRKL